MLEALLQITISILPWFVVGGLVRYINVHNQKKWKELNSDRNAESSDQKYEIAYPPTIYGIMYVCTILFFLGLFFSYRDNQLDWFTGTIFGGLFILGVYGVLGTHVWKIWVDGEIIVYRGYNGIKHYYTFSEITRIDRKLNGAYVYYAGKKRLFKIDNNVVGGTILTGDLMQNGVPCALEGMSIDKFTLKPQTVYYVISAMCASSFAYFIGIIVKQNEISGGYFILMLIGLAISIVLLIDLLTDRFSVNGNEVIRRRGVLKKRFKVNEIDYVRLKKGLFRENLEIYVDKKCVTKVWMKNRPFNLLRERLAKEKIGYRR